MNRICLTGRRSFQPTLESLETRDVADAGFGRAVLSSLVAPPVAAHVGQFNPTAATSPANADLNKEILAAGRKFAEQVIQRFLQRNFQFSDADFKNVGELKGSVYLNERIDNVHQPDHGGVWVGVSLERSADYAHDESIHVTLQCDLNFRFKYEGRVDGVDRFTLTSFRSMDRSRWLSDLDGGRHKRKDVSPSAYFGVVDAALKKDYVTFSMKAETGPAQQMLGAAPQGGFDRTSLPRIAIDQLWVPLGSALRNSPLKIDRVLDIKVDSSTKAVGKNNIRLDVTVEMQARNRDVVTQRLTLVLTRTGGDRWTLQSLSQDDKGSHKFSEPVLNVIRSALKSIHTPAGFGQATSDKLNDAFAGKELQGQKVEGFLLQGSKTGTTLRAEVTMYLSNGKAERLEFELSRGPGRNEWVATSCTSDSAFLDAQSLQALRDAVRGVFVP